MIKLTASCMVRGTYGHAAIIRIEWKYMDIAVRGPE